MAGLYLHIPFCKQACHYCNFHFSTSLRYKTQMVEAICRELEWRQEYLEGASLSSIYFGGGTPSLLSAPELEQLFEKIHQLFEVEATAEVTLEANPDDLTDEKLLELRQTPINRLSIGIQSFFEEDLRFMNRAHNAREAKNCIIAAKKAGFDQLTIDLIYGSPTTSDESWIENLALFFEYDLPHLSAYALTVEPQTALAHFVKTGKAPAVKEEKAARQFEVLMNEMERKGYEHYEISNFALPGKYAKHNSSYWKKEPYLGVGPAAHSFNGTSRQWNKAHNAHYMKAHSLVELPYEREVLEVEEQYNEYVMTGLRTIWGVNQEDLLQFGERYWHHFETEASTFLKTGKMEIQADRYRLTKTGKLMADYISAMLFV